MSANVKAAEAEADPLTTSIPLSCFASDGFVADTMVDKKIRSPVKQNYGFSLPNFFSEFVSGMRSKTQKTSNYFVTSFYCDNPK
jgi:CRISPR/Cas system type I-B associated protein Csh2 (Cas7 group RAMP superfamily)